MFVEYLRVKNSQQPLPPPFFLQSHRNPITYFSSSAASKVPLSHVTCGKNAQAAGCSKTHFHLTCARVQIQGYDDLRYYSKHKVTLNPPSLFVYPLDLSFHVKLHRLFSFLSLFTALFITSAKTISFFPHTILPSSSFNRNQLQSWFNTDQMCIIYIAAMILWAFLSLSVIHTGHRGWGSFE